MMADPPMHPARVPTAIGTLELLLPADAVLAPDPGVADGEMLAWAPAPELGGFSISHGPAAGRRAEDLLALERGFADGVEVERDDDEELLLCVVTEGSRDLVEDPSGTLTGTEGTPRRERVRFRFWQSGDEAVRAGYRLDEAAPGELRATFERITDSLRLEGPP